MVLLRRNLELTKLKLCGMERDGRQESKDILAGTKLNEDDVIVSKICIQPQLQLRHVMSSRVNRRAVSLEQVVRHQ